MELHEWGLSMTLPLLMLCGTVLDTTEARLVYRTPARTARNKALSKPDEYKKTPDFIESAGLEAEVHEVTTEDGYIIHLDRRPADVLDSSKVVLIVHGIFGASDNWVLYGRKSFPMLLSDAGYDAWIINTRGNAYSHKHVNYTNADPRFWKFSFHEQGYYDVAACIDYIIENTKAAQIFLLGHSRGTTVNYILLSTRPEYNQKVKLLISFAPVAYLKHAKSPILQPLFKEVEINQTKKIIRNANILDLPGVLDDPMRHMRKGLCNAHSPVRKVCLTPLNLFNGIDSINSAKMYELFFSHFPDAASVRELFHFLQLAQRDDFAQYDFGSPSKNLAKYNLPAPPPYPVEKITVPAVFWYSDNDNIVSKQDMDRLLRRVPNIVGLFRVPLAKFSHINFIFSPVSDNLLYKPVIQFMNKYI